MPATAMAVEFGRRWSRSEAYADYVAGRNLAAFRHRVLPPRPSSPARRAGRALAIFPARIWRGRPRRLAIRILTAAILAFLVTLTGAGTPAMAALITGISTWLVLTSRGDLAPPPRSVNAMPGGRGCKTVAGGWFFSHLAWAGTPKPGRPGRA
jgi:hypothetical protein